MFDIGDKVVHPIHGAGLVKGIKEQDLLEQYHRYYVIDLAVDDRTLMIPIGNAGEIGLRSISREAALSKVWRTLSGAGEVLSDDYKERQKRVQKKLRTGDVIKVAEVIRDLSTLKREDHLTSFDTKLLEKAQQSLSSEVALACFSHLSKRMESKVDPVMKRETPYSTHAGWEFGPCRGHSRWLWG